MVETPQPYASLRPALSLPSIKSLVPSSPPWLSKFIPLLHFSPPACSTSTLVSFVALLLALAYTCIHYFHHYLLRRRAMESASRNPFPFMSLPPELREMVYESLLEDPYYPVPASNSKHAHSHMLSWMMPSRRPSLQERNSKQCNFIFMANRQIYAEFMDLLCKKRVFHLTVSPANYTAPLQDQPQPSPPAPAATASRNPATTTTTNPAPSLDTASASADAKEVYSTPPQSPRFKDALSQQPSSDKKTSKIWNVSTDVLKKVRRCDIKLITTSSMLGVPDPRNMPPSSWALAQQVRSELSSIPLVQELNLHVKAIGDPLWNPLWVWYHASQSFKTMGTPSTTSPTPATTPTQNDKDSSTSDTSTTEGPKLTRITFSLDTWSPGENHLQRNPESGDWEWFCMKGHCVGADGGIDMTVREFCARLYTECRACRPELESEDEDEDDGDEDDDVVIGGGDGQQHDDDDDDDVEDDENEDEEEATTTNTTTTTGEA